MPDSIRGVNPTQPPDVAATGQAAQAPTSGATVRQSAPAPVDSADVTRAEALLASIATAAESVPAVNQARIADLQRAILSGNYQINSQQIAEKLVELEQLLASQGR